MNQGGAWEVSFVLALKALACSVKPFLCARSMQHFCPTQPRRLPLFPLAHSFLSPAAFPVCKSCFRADVELL